MPNTSAAPGDAPVGPRVIFSGSYTQRNVGDMALHLATRGILAAERGDVRIVVHARHPVEDPGA